jgi:tRNA A-37 threonylcarbamoyl transferase component Bud32
MLVGKQLGPFKIDKPLGSGAMGAVYRAKYEKTGGFVAIKLMAPALSTNEQSLARFEREANILKQLKHPNIVRLLATGRFQGQPFYAMEYIQGESLDHVLERRQRLMWEEVVAIAQPLCSALQHAHEQGIIHRDLKPSNLMVLKDGNVKLTDFGIAKDLDVTQLTSAHCTVGTAAYMSPEQCKGERVLTNKSDLYSLGVMLYELVTGQKPFAADTPMQMFLQHVQGKFERPSRLVLDIPPWLDTLICQLLEKKPELRPIDAAMVAKVLSQIEKKVQEQKSAGVDAVEKRRADRVSAERTKPEEEDMAAARALQVAIGKKKTKRRKIPPILERKWVQASGIVVLLGVIVGALAFAFKPPSADTLYRRANDLMDSSDTDKWEEARDGPIAEFLKRYRKTGDDKTEIMEAWRDKADTISEERSLWKRRERSTDQDYEKPALAALDHELHGMYVEARDEWEVASNDWEKTTGPARKTGLVANKKLAEMKESEARQAVLEKKLRDATGADLKWQDKSEALAAKALKLQIEGRDPDGAKGIWTSLKAQNEESWETGNSETKHDSRLWWLMAIRNKQELERKPKGSGSTSSGSPSKGSGTSSSDTSSSSK